MMIRSRHAILGTAVFAALAGAARAQTATWDPSQLPSIQGRVAQYSLTPRGDADGLILEDGTEVHLPPRLSTQLVFAVHPGDSITVHGLKAIALPLVQAISITDDASGRSVTDIGAPGPGTAGSLTATGRIRMQLHGPRGDMNGVLLEDGTIIRLPPPEAARLQGMLAPGLTVFASGDGVALPYGRAIAAEEIGPDAARAEAITTPPPPRPGPQLRP